MYRILLLALLFLAVPNLSSAQEDKAAPSGASAPSAAPGGTREVLIPNIPMWQRFVEVFVVALLVLIVCQLMMMRSDLNAMFERLSSPSGSSVPPLKR